MLKKIIEGAGYTNQQIFNMDEISLFWEKLWILTLTSIETCKFAEMWIKHCIYQHMCEDVNKERTVQSTLLKYFERQ
jgi:hypothetical protein